MEQVDNTILEEIKDFEEKEIYLKYFLPRYRNKNYEQEILLLLKNKIIHLNTIETDVIIDLWQTYSWAKDFIIENIEEICTEFNYNKITQLIILSMKDKKDFIRLYESIFGSKNATTKVMVIDILLDLGFPATEELIINPLRHNKNSEELEKNHIFDILEYRLDDLELRDVFLNHFEELFNSAIHEKMQILSTVLELDSNIDSELIDKYGLLLSYYRQVPSENQKWADEIISNIIENNSDKKLLSNIKERFNEAKLILKESGSFSIVLGTKEWVLKLCKDRITWNNPRKSYLLNPSEFEVVLDKSGIPIAGIEWQEYLPITNKKITKELIYKYLVEFRNQNLTIADSTILAYNSQNFRFLKDTTKIKEEYQDIPEWFLENPIVSIDIDAIYERGENKEADKAMDDAISRFGK